MTGDASTPNDGATPATPTVAAAAADDEVVLEDDEPVLTEDERREAAALPGFRRADHLGDDASPSVTDAGRTAPAAFQDTTTTPHPPATPVAATRNDGTDPVPAAAEQSAAGDGGVLADARMADDASPTSVSDPPVATPNLSTGCDALDRLLDGGLESDAVTLVFGEGGSGKTNLALQCSLQAVMAGHRVAYVDTEGVSPVRLQQIMDGLPALQDVASTAAELPGLRFISPFDFSEQEQLVEKATRMPGLGLVVVDSINLHYRLVMDSRDGEREAGRRLLRQLHHLMGFARRHDVPVLVTGQVYDGEDGTLPFARRTMEHLVKAMVRFEKRPDGSRRATVLKHRSIEDGRHVRFRIGPHGLVAI